MSSKDARNVRAEDRQEHEEAHEPVSGPFQPGLEGQAEPTEWLTPQVAHPIPLRSGVEEEREAS
jgi:hypothetical protein